MFNINKNLVLGSVTNASKVLMRGGISTNVHSVAPSFSTGLLQDVLNDKSEQVLNAIYREIYIYDSVSGPAVDLMSTLPYSEWTIEGVDDEKQKRIFEETLYELNFTELMEQITTSYLVLGKVIGTLLFNEKRGIFTDLIIHNPDHCEIIDIPVRGYDPKINLKVPPEFSKFLRSQDQRDKEARSEFPQKILTKLMSSSKVELEPLNTLFLTRGNIPGIKGISYFSRILPLWMIEKALIRGTILGAWKRQRSILHIVAGNDDWEPTPEQLNELATLFITADLDPQGAVVATRQGIETSEVRSGSDFWKFSDDADLFANAKMRALGINESFLSGDTNYNTADVALSVFIENIRSLRENLTRRVLDNKIFMLISKYHGFKKRTKAEIQHRVRISSSRFSEFSSEYIIPKLHWTKTLQPTSDQAYLELLSSVSEKGLPITLKLFASAAGVDIDKLIQSYDDDVKLRKVIKEYKDKIKKYTSEEESGELEASVKEIKGEVDKIPDELTLTQKQAASILEMNKKRGL